MRHYPHVSVGPVRFRAMLVTWIFYHGEYIAYGEGYVKPMYRVYDDPPFHVLDKLASWPTFAKWVPYALVQHCQMTEAQLEEQYGPLVDPKSGPWYVNDPP